MQQISPPPAVHATEVPADAYLLDVREEHEWSAGHVEGAVHIPMGDLVERVHEIPREQDVYVMCRVGGRSAQVAHYLNAHGWRTINVDGGMLAWEAAGRPMAGGNGHPCVV